MPTQLWRTSGTGRDDFIVLGGGADSANGGGGDDLLIGDSITPFTYGTTTSQAGPANLDSPLFWSTDENPFVTDATIPHTSLFVVADPAQKHYASVTVGAGETITIDIDFGDFDAIGENADLVVGLYDSTATLLVSNDDNDIQLGGGGSGTSHDSYLTYTNTSGTAQTYVIQFSEFPDTGFTGGETFVANISVTGHDASLPIEMGNDILTGADGDDTLAGQGGDDILLGGAGDDSLYGGSGDDRLDGGTGRDTAWYNDAEGAVIIDLTESGAQDTGGAGIDTITGVENLVGSQFDDALFGNDDSNFIRGGGGRDTILGGLGNDSIEGQDGDDTLFGGAGADFLNADFRRDALIHSNNALYGQAGNDVLQGWFGNDILSGGDGDDTIEDPGGNDSINGGAGIDLLQYSSATAGVTVDLRLASIQDTVGAGHDRILGIENLWGSRHDDTLIGNAGANQIMGLDGNDIIDGDAGDDTLLGYLGDDVIIGGAGIDTLSFLYSGAITVNLAITSAQNTGEGMDTISGIENVSGSQNDDVIYGDAGSNVLDGGVGDDNIFGRDGNDTLIGGNGDDSLWGGDGNDVLHGEAGIDTASYAGAAGAVTVSLAITSAQNTGGAGTDTLDGIESLLGSANNDTLTGDGQANRIDGGAGADQMSGAGGNDTYVVDNSGDAVSEGLSAGTDLVLSSVNFSLGSNVENLRLTGVGAINAFGNSLANVLIGNSAVNVLIGGAGNDTLTGAAGDDKFRFDTALDSSTNVDRITDYSAGHDRIQIDDDIFTAAGAIGTLASTAFYAGTAAHDADDRIIYDSATGRLYYDADGNGAGAAVLFAQVSAGALLTNADFQIIA